MGYKEYSPLSKGRKRISTHSLDGSISMTARKKTLFMEEEQQEASLQILMDRTAEKVASALKAESAEFSGSLTAALIFWKIHSLFRKLDV
jgi:hypothetical protein